MEKFRILIVEDDESVLKIYKKFLIDDAFDKQCVIDGSRAFETYKSWRPEIIILDIMLPGMSGYKVLKEIRQTCRDVTTPVIMATSVSTKNSIADCMELGIQGYLIKPFKAKELPEKVLSCFEQAEPARVQGARRLIEENYAHRSNLDLDVD